ncbi:hypothetical protein ABFS82_04G060000 [Erythranthe guttata]
MSTTTTTTASRRTKWHPTPPPPPSPKILHFPRSRRTRRRQSKPTTQNHHNNNPLLLMHQNHPSSSSKGKLENLFDQETSSPPEFPDPNSKIPVAGRRERVAEDDGGFAEEKWRFQAEILRAECNLLRMEREFALKKLEKNRVKMERTLKSAVQTLVSGRDKIFEGKNAKAVLEEEIEVLADKLNELQKIPTNKDSQIRNLSNNFDKKACVLQRRLEKLGGLSDEPETNKSSTNVDMVKKKMEGLSKGMLERVEQEYNSILSSTANSSVASSASSSKRIDCPDFSARHFFQEQMGHENKCSGRCKIIVRRIVEQVRAETEQWSQMQEMLGQVRGEMEQLNGSRDFWENRARNSDVEIQSLRHAVEEWKERARAYENKANEAQLELSILKEEIQKSRTDLSIMTDIPAVPLGRQLDKERVVLSFRSKENEQGYSPSKDLPPLSLGKQLANEKRMLLHRLKEKRNAREKGKIMCSNGTGAEAPTRRSPLREIGNSSPLAKQKSRSAFCLHSPESSRIRESFRK